MSGSPIIVAVIQSILGLFAGIGLWRLWRKAASTHAAVAWLVTAGVVVRGVGGAIVFAISYLGLPVGRSLQLGRGFWIFGLDSMSYFQRASEAAARGPMAIINFPRDAASPFFQQTLATALLAFGSVASTAILLNVAAYLGCCLVGLSFGDPAKHRGVIFAVAALTLSPSIIFWSLQPLKDVTFLFLVAGFFAAALAWQRAANEGDPVRQIAALAFWTLALSALLYAITGIRYYFGLILLAGSLPFLVLTVVSARRWLRAAAGAVVLVPFLCAAILAGGGPYIPAGIRAALLLDQPDRIGSVVQATLTQSRAGFESSGGATMIGTGPAVQWLDRALGVRENRVPTARMGLPRKQTTAVNHEIPGPTVAMPGSPLTRLVVGFSALVLPRAAAEHLGLVGIGGGHGLWPFAELDTLAFDAVLLVAIVSLIGGIRKGRFGPPVFWLVFIVTSVFCVALVYTVTNFGTLFRHRDMILIGLTLLPLAMLDRQAGVRSAGKPEMRTAPLRNPIGAAAEA